MAIKGGTQTNGWTIGVLALLSFLILPNLPFLIFGFIYPRAFFNLDFLLLGAVTPWLRKWVVLVFYLVLAAVDLLSVVAQTYFFDIPDLIYSLQFSGKLHFQLGHLFSPPIAMLPVCAIVGVLIATRLAGNGKKVVTPLCCGLGLVIFLIDFASGNIAYPPIAKFSPSGQVRLLPWNLATSGTLLPGSNILRRIVGGEPYSPSAARWDNVGSATRIALGLSVNETFAKMILPDANIALILVESLGSSSDAEFENWVSQPIKSPAVLEHYWIRRGTIGFFGPTVRGEIRELCGKLGGYQKLAKMGHDCLPFVLTAKGYSTTGLHGFDGRMFRRTIWWPQSGLQHQAFLGDSAFAHKSLCGSVLPGVCDATAVDALSNALSRRGRQFAYLLTLNSHLPLSDPDAAEKAVACTNHFKNSEECALAVSLRRLFVAISRAAVRQSDRPTIFIVVGDHSPPVASIKARKYFSTKSVPYFILWPRALTRTSTEPKR